MIVILGGSGFAARTFFKQRFLQATQTALPGPGLEEFLKTYDLAWTSILLASLAAFSLLTFWSGKGLLFPLGRVLMKAQRILNENQSLSPGALGRQASGERDEWSELEYSIDHIREDLEAKSESLSREREELTTLMAAISDAILAVDLEGVPLFFNSRFALLFGAESRLQKRDIRVWEIFRAPEILEAFKDALVRKQPGSVKALQVEQPGGAKMFFSLSVSPLRKSSGEIYGAVGIFHDVTELKSAEQIRIDFVANVSHELRTPLTAIKGYTDTLIEDMQTKRPISQDFLDIISRNVSRLMNLIGDLLDLSSLESTDLIQRDSVNTAEITARVIKQLSGGFEAKNQKVEAEVRASLVNADPRRLEQVLVNLLDNAHKYSPSGGKLRVIWEADGIDVLLKIADNGPGIPPEHHPRLFERFYRVDKARSRDQGGTGLGLAIVKHIMQRHGGSVSVESRLGQGATFVCRFPG